MQARHTKRPTQSRTKNPWLLLMCSLGLLFALSAGSSAANAHSHHESSSTSAKSAKLHLKQVSQAEYHRFKHKPDRPRATEPTTTVPTTEPTTEVPSTPEPSTATPTEPTPTTEAPGTESTAGVPSGTSLRASGSLTITQAGTVVEGLDIQGSVNINASDVTIRRSKISGASFALINVARSAENVRIENVEIDGRGTSGAEGSHGVMGPADVINSDIRGVENGIGPAGGSTLTGNYIHHLAAPGSPHYDGIQIDGGFSNIVISKNTIDMREHGQTSAVMIDNYFGPVSNVTVTGNRLLGGGYTVYSDAQFSGGPITGVSFTHNRLGKGHWGYHSIVKNSVEWNGNVDDVSGAAVNR